MASASMAGAALNAGSGITSTIFSGIFGRNQQRRQHSYDMQMAQMNYDYGREMLKRQQDYQTQMWNAENEYNSAKNQRARLEEAGLNPYLMLDGGNAGTASSVTSPSSSPGNASNSASPFKVDTSGIQQAGQAIADVVNYATDYKGQKSQTEAQTEGMQAEATSKKADAKVASAKALAQLEGIQKDNEGKGISNEIEGMKRDILAETKQTEIDSRKLEYDNLQVEYQGKILQNMLTQKTINTYDEKFNREMSFLAAQTFAAYASGELSKKQAFLAYEQAFKVKAEANGVRWNNKLIAKTFDANVRIAEANAKKAEREALTAGNVPFWNLPSSFAINGSYILDDIGRGISNVSSKFNSFVSRKFDKWRNTKQYTPMPFR